MSAGVNLYAAIRERSSEEPTLSVLWLFPEEYINQERACISLLLSRQLAGFINPSLRGFPIAALDEGWILLLGQA